jgi:hypothetical protein
MSLLEPVRAARRYLAGETARLAAPDAASLAPTIPEFTIFKGVVLDRDTALVPIEPGHGPRRFDNPVALFLETAVALGCRLRLNSREAGKREGKGNFYVRLDIPRRGGPPLNVSASRIIADPGVGRRVRENTSDFRNLLREGLRTEESPLEHGPNKSRTTRLGAIEAILQAYDTADDLTRAVIARSDLEALLVGLLTLADARSAIRLAEAKRAA